MQIVVQRIACGPLIAAAPAYHAVGAMVCQIYGGVLVHRPCGDLTRLAEPRGRGRTPPLCGCPEFYSFRGPAGRTHTCRKRRQVRDLVIAQTGGRPLLSACHVSGSEGRRRGDSLRNLFALQLQSEEFQKPLVFGGVLSPVSSAAGRNGAAGGIEEKSRQVTAAKSDPRSGARSSPCWRQIQQRRRRQKNCKVRQKNIDFSGAVL